MTQRKHELLGRLSHLIQVDLHQASTGIHTSNHPVAHIVWNDEAYWQQGNNQALHISTYRGTHADKTYTVHVTLEREAIPLLGELLELKEAAELEAKQRTDREQGAAVIDAACDALRRMEAIVPAAGAHSSELRGEAARLRQALEAAGVTILTPEELAQRHREQWELIARGAPAETEEEEPT